MLCPKRASLGRFSLLSASAEKSRDTKPSWIFCYSSDQACRDFAARFCFFSSLAADIIFPPPHISSCSIFIANGMKLCRGAAEKIIFTLPQVSSRRKLLIVQRKVLLCKWSRWTFGEVTENIFSEVLWTHLQSSKKVFFYVVTQKRNRWTIKRPNFFFFRSLWWFHARRRWWCEKFP